MWESQRTLAAVMRLGPLVSASSLKVRFEPFILRRALAEAITVCRKAAAEHVRSPRFELAPDVCDSRIVGDRALLTRAFTNVVLNAAQFCFPTAHSRYEPVRVECEPHRDSVRVLVSNHGPLIPNADAIFQAFRVGSARPTDLARPRGLGLGLVIAHRIAQAHNGTVGLVRSVALADGLVHENVFEIRLPKNLEPGVRQHMFGS